MRRRRRAAEEAERAAEAMQARSAAVEREARLLRHALELVPAAVVVVGDDGAEIARNQRAAGLVGDRPADVLVADAVRKALAAAGVGGREERVVELHGPPRRALRVVAERIGDGGVGGGVGDGGVAAVVEDESERRRLDAVRRDFVANVSHELRTPIGALSLLAETMADEQDPAVVKRLALRVATEAERAAALVADLLDLSRIESDVRGSRELLDLNEVVDTAVRRAQEVADQAGIAFTVHATPEEAVVDADRDQLLSAVCNLLHNAVHYSDRGTTVEVAVRTHAQAEAEAGYVDVCVRDRGIGIPAKDLERVFERFYRVDRARDRRTGGTGLGLSIVRHVATNHGGDVLVESTEGEGSLFTLRLPAAGRA